MRDETTVGQLLESFDLVEARSKAALKAKLLKLRSLGFGNYEASDGTRYKTVKDELVKVTKSDQHENPWDIPAIAGGVTPKEAVDKAFERADKGDLQLFRRIRVDAAIAQSDLRRILSVLVRRVPDRHGRQSRAPRLRRVLRPCVPSCRSRQSAASCRAPPGLMQTTPHESYVKNSS